MNSQKKDNPNATIDVKDVSLGDLIAVLKRLKVSSVIWIVGIVIAVLGAIIGFIRKTDIAIFDTKVAFYQDSLSGLRHRVDSINNFQNFYSLRFSDKNTLQKIIPNIVEGHFDGIKTYEEALECLVWQVRSQGGFAEFLKDTMSTVLTLNPDSTSIHFDWQHRPNVLLKIFQNLHIEVSPEELAQRNAELNFFGMTWLNDRSTVVRDNAGGLEVVK